MSNKSSKEGKQRVLPNFLGIGFTKCGTTWFAEILKSHPEVFMPVDKKEIHFFSKYYEKCLDWYRQFFPTEKGASRYGAIGEFTPTYINGERFLRIKESLPNAKFIIILRNPAERAKSALRYRNKHRVEEQSVDDYIEKMSDRAQKNVYSDALRRWFSEFPPGQFLTLIYEELKENPEKELEKTAEFLGVDAKGFDKKVISNKYNKTFTPRNKFIFIRGRKFIHWLREKNLDKLANILKKSAIPLLAKKSSGKKTSEQEKNLLRDFYKEEVLAVEKILGRKIKVWH